MLGKEKRVEQRSKQIEGKLPSLPAKESEKNALEYVSMVYEGTDKVEAFKAVFPDRYKNSVEFANAKGRDERAMVMSTISAYETGKYVSKLYSLGRDEYWKRWIHKKTRALEKVYDMAMDEGVDEEGNPMSKYSERTQLTALKMFMENVPDIKEDNTINVKHHISADKEFLDKIKARKEALLSNDDIILDAEMN